MKKKIIMMAMVMVMTISMLAGCGSTDEAKTGAAGDAVGKAGKKLIETITEAPTEATTEAPTPEPAEAPHEHNYTAEVITELTCETNGVTKYTCECGDTYEDEQVATGHIFGAYTSNNDATYTADGTETAKCNNCDATDTRVVKGSMLTYSYTDMNATMYAQKSVNVRSLPSADGKKLGGLSTNDEVKVTGQCAETSWYRIEYNGQVGYVSNNYLGKDKVVVKEQPANNGQTTSVTLNSYREAAEYAISLGYPIGQAVDNGDGTAYMYWIGNTVLPYSEETNAQFEVYLDSARKSADSLFGQGTNYYFNDLYDGKVIKQLGNGYTVYRETYKPRPDLGFPRK